jgi:hypothetical protein
MTGVVIIVVLVVLAFFISWRVNRDMPVDDIDSAEGFFDEIENDKD